MPLTYFEVATALGFLAMAEAGVEVAVLEVGLGGRLDATNVCRPLATAITSIGLDHTDVLGDHAGGHRPGEGGHRQARACRCTWGRCHRRRRRWRVRWRRRCGRRWGRLGVDLGPAPVAPALAGPHQQHNAALAVALARAAAEALGSELPRGGHRARPAPGGLARRGWSGWRPTCCSTGPTTWRASRRCWRALPDRRPRVLLLSVVRGKPAAEMLALAAGAFDRPGAHPLAQPPGARSRRAGRAVARGRAGGRCRCRPTPSQALAEARARVAPGGLVVVAGSLFLAGEIRAHLRGEPVDPIPGGDPMP